MESPDKYTAQACKCLCALKRYLVPLAVRRWHTEQKQVQWLVQLTVKILNFGRNGWLNKWEEVT